MIKVVHLTSAHPRFDSRIFHKMCRSTVDHGHAATLVVADGLGDSVVSGVRIVDAGKPRGRVSRITRGVRRVGAKALALDADVYHVHDPELLTITGALLDSGRVVIFDSHEDLPRQLLNKDYLPPLVRTALSRLASVYEARVARKLSGIVCATDSIERKFRQIKSSVVTVKNYPMIGELSSEPRTRHAGSNAVCYVGSMSLSRGIIEICEAVNRAATDARLILAGDIEDGTLKRQVCNYASAGKIEAVGFVDRSGVREVLRRSAAGLVTLHPTASYVDSLPIKLFEYMSAGLPVIASDFPLWRDIVRSADCGILVNPLDSLEIARAIDWLLSHPAEAEAMGRRGQMAVARQYNWDPEAAKLLSFYADLQPI